MTISLKVLDEFNKTPVKMPEYYIIYLHTVVLKFTLNKYINGQNSKELINKGLMILQRTKGPTCPTRIRTCIK